MIAYFFVFSSCCLNSKELKEKFDSIVQIHECILQTKNEYKFQTNPNFLIYKNSETVNNLRLKLKNVDKFGTPFLRIHKISTRKHLGSFALESIFDYNFMKIYIYLVDIFIKEINFKVEIVTKNSNLLTTALKLELNHQYKKSCAFLSRTLTEIDRICENLGSSKEEIIPTDHKFFTIEDQLLESEFSITQNTHENTNLIEHDDGLTKTNISEEIVDKNDSKDTKKEYKSITFNHKVNSIILKNNKSNIPVLKNSLKRQNTCNKKYLADGKSKSFCLNKNEIPKINPHLKKVKSCNKIESNKSAIPVIISKESANADDINPEINCSSILFFTTKENQFNDEKREIVEIQEEKISRLRILLKETLNKTIENHCQNVLAYATNKILGKCMANLQDLFYVFIDLLQYDIYPDETVVDEISSFIECYNDFFKNFVDLNDKESDFD